MAEMRDVQPIASSSESKRGVGAQAQVPMEDGKGERKKFDEEELWENYLRANQKYILDGLPDLNGAGFPARRGWMWTDFLMTSSLQDFRDDGSNMYIKRGLEQCPKTGRWHLQSMGWWKKNVKPTWIWQIVGYQCHIEPINADFAGKYSEKDGNFEVAGTLGKKGQDLSLAEVYADCKNSGGNLKEVADKHPETFMKYSNAITKAVMMHEKSPGFQSIKVIALYGLPRTGKSSYAESEFGVENVYKVDAAIWRRDFWDGYNGQGVLVIDFDDQPFMKPKELLHLTDGSVNRVNVKSSGLYGRWHTVFVISNHHPNDWFANYWKKFPDQKKALEERFDQVVYIDKVMPHLVKAGVKSSELRSYEVM